MNETNATAATIDGNFNTRRSDLIDHLIILAKHRKSLIVAPLIVALVAATISFALPDVYKASTKLLPPQQSQGGAAALLSQLGGVASLAGAAAGIKNPNDLYVGMLKSRTIADKLIQQYDLKNVYSADTLEETRSELQRNTRIASAKDGLITIEVEDKDRERVAKITNAYVHELLKLTKVLAITEAAQRRMFFEQQLELSKDNLVKAENKFSMALNTHGVISVDADSRAVVETVGRLRAQIAAKEIQLNSMQAFVTTSNTEYKRAREELNSLRGELSKLQNGRPALATDSGARGRKQAGLENIQILRDVKYHQMLYELLAKQYELARLDEAKDAAVVQVLDAAIEPERKFKPRRALIVLGAAFLALLATLGWVFLHEGIRKTLQTPERAARWKMLRAHF